MTLQGMKYNSIDVADVRAYLADDAYWLEQKLDGVHVMVHVREGEVRFTGVSGRPITFAAASQHLRKTGAIYKAFAKLPDCVLDGELMIHSTATHLAGTLYVFDMPRWDTIVDVKTRFDVRRIALEKLFELMDFGSQVKLVRVARSAEEKLALWDDLVKMGAEGGVFKQFAMPYRPGPKRTNAVLKAKLTTTIDVIVLERNVDGKENAHLGLMRNGVVIEVGRCSMIGKVTANVGDVIEVECLHVSDDNRLYQPRMVSLRLDKELADCQWDQLEAGRVNRAAA